MNDAIRIIVGLLLIAHGLIHLLYLAPDVPELSATRGWLPERMRRPVALVLMVGTVVAFTMLGLAVWGVPGLADAWPGIAIVAASLSLVLFVAFWVWALAFGVIIDVAIIVVALFQPD